MQEKSLKRLNRYDLADMGSPLPMLAEPGARPTPPRTADFDLARTLTSGQVFRWREVSVASQGSRTFSGWIGAKRAEVAQQGQQITVRGVSAEQASRFFALDLDLKEIARQIDVDPVIHAALQRYRGLRIIRQDPWECTASFILSSFNNIPRLAGMIETLAFRFGEVGDGPDEGCGDSQDKGEGTALRWGAQHRTVRDPPARDRSLDSSGRALAKLAVRRRSMPARPPERALPVPPAQGPVHSAEYCFPRPEVLAKVSERTLRNCGLGFRAPYLKAAAEAVAAGTAPLEDYRCLEDDELRRSLCKIPGVGEKVVECILLFAYERTAAFPVDIWIGRAMRSWYFHGRKVADRQIREFAGKHFGPYCGWAQQYLYCAARARTKE